MEPRAYVELIHKIASELPIVDNHSIKDYILSVLDRMLLRADPTVMYEQAGCLLDDEYCRTIHGTSSLGDNWVPETVLSEKANVLLSEPDPVIDSEFDYQIPVVDVLKECEEAVILNYDADFPEIPLEESATPILTSTYDPVDSIYAEDIEKINELQQKMYDAQTVRLAAIPPLEYDPVFGVPVDSMEEMNNAMTSKFDTDHTLSRL